MNNISAMADGMSSQRNGGERVFRRDGGTLFNKYFNSVEKWRKVIVAMWLVILAVSLWVGPAFLTMGNDNQDPPSGTRAYDDQQEFVTRFSEKSKELPVLVVISCQSCDLSKDKQISWFSTHLISSIQMYNNTHGNVLSLMGYFTQSHLKNVREQFMSKDKRVTFLSLTESSKQLTNDRYNFIKWLNNEIESHNPDDSVYSIGVTGFDAMAYEGVGATADELKKVDSITIPLAMALLAFMVRSWRLLLIAFFNMGTSIMMGFAFMVFLVKGCGFPRPESASAQLMEVMALSLSIDYCLFLCRRFRDEIKGGAGTTEAVYRSMLTAGHVVVMSGLTILAVFLGFLFLPARVVRMDGTSCAVGVSCSLLVALTNTPAMLLTFPEFFSTFDGCCGYGKRDTKITVDDSSRSNSVDSFNVEGTSTGRLIDEEGAIETGLLENNFLGEDDALNEPLNHEPENEPSKVHPMYRGLRFRITKFVTTWPYNVISILALYALVIPLAIQVGRLQVNQDILVGIPRHSKSGDTFRRMVEGFPGGTFSPFYVVATEPVGKSILNHKMFHTLQSVAAEIIATPECEGQATCASNPAFVNGKKIWLDEAKSLLFMAEHVCSSDMIAKVTGAACEFPLEYKFLFDQSVNPQKDAVLTTVIVPFFPFAQKSSGFIDKIYEILDKHSSTGKNGIGLYLCGFEVGFDSIMRHVYHLFPMLIAITLVTVFLVLGLMLRSAFVPIRLALTLLLPLAAVFGLAVLVYQDGILKNFSEATKPTNGFFWYIPILITSISCGLCLDYDVFLISRIQEHRAAGYDAQAAIVKAACETGGTISAAGLIMTACFGGMLLSSQGTINESGWLLSTGVILDTFVVNVILVPALMSIGDSIAWWPSKMPMNSLVSINSAEFTGRSDGIDKPIGATRLSDSDSSYDSSSERNGAV